MKTLAVLAFVSILATTSATRAKAEDKYTKQMFAQALDKGGFVLITVRYPSDGSERRVCTMSTFLEGAIHTEYGLSYDMAGNKRAEQIALSRWNQVMSFSKRKAFENIKPKYTPEQLAEIRRTLANFTRPDLRKALQSSRSDLDKLYAGRKRAMYEDAVAHALLERGIPVGMDDRTSLLAPLPSD